MQESLGRQFENLDAHDACHFLLYTEVTLAKIVDKPEEAEAILKERGILQ